MSRRPPFRLVSALCALCLLLCSCWLPEHYVARIKIEADGSYKVFAEGTAVHVESVMARSGPAPAGGKPKAGAQKREQDAQALFQKDLAQLMADKRVLSASPIENGRVRFSVGGDWRIDTAALILSEAQTPLAFATGPDGTLRVRVKDAVPRPEARAMGVKSDGDVSVVLAEGVEVLEHNAQAVPTSPRGAYRWKITPATTEAPYLKLRLPGAKAQAAPRAQGGGHGAGAQKGLAHQ